MSADTSDADLDAYSASNGCGACIGTGQITTSYANGKAAFYDSGRVLLWRGSGDIVEITNEVLNEAGGGEPSRESLGGALVMLAANSSLQKYGDW